MSSIDKKTPIIAICGFLGAGKTTLLNHILSTQNGRKIAVIVNDFGAINVDSMLIASQTEDTMRLSNGTICCAVGDDSIDAVVDRLAHKYSMIDMIIIEASGAAEPTHLVKALLRLDNDYAKFDSLLYVIDACEYKKTLDEHPEIKEHIETADCIILNKIDLVGDDKKQQIKKQISKIVPSAIQIESSYGKVDFDLLIGSIKDNRGTNESQAGAQLSLTADEDHHDHDHIHDKLISTTFKSTEPMDHKLLVSFFDNPPKGLYRLKGWIDFGVKGLLHTFIAQFVSGRWQMHVYKGSQNLTGTELLIIGNQDMDKDSVLQQLKDCVDKNPSDVSQDKMVDILKYDKEI